MRQLAGIIKDKIVGPSTAIGARPSLSTDGLDVTSWREGPGTFAPPSFEIFIDGAGASSLAAPATGSLGVELWGYVASRNSWYFLASLNKGVAVPVIGAGQGYAEIATLPLGDHDRLAVAATVTGAAVTASFGPIESWTY